MVIIYAHRTPVGGTNLFDDATLTNLVFFADGFESGDTSAWSSTVPWTTTMTGYSLRLATRCWSGLEMSILSPESGANR